MHVHQLLLARPVYATSSRCLPPTGMSAAPAPAETCHSTKAPPLLQDKLQLLCFNVLRCYAPYTALPPKTAVVLLPTAVHHRRHVHAQLALLLTLLWQWTSMQCCWRTCGTEPGPVACRKRLLVCIALTVCLAAPQLHSCCACCDDGVIVAAVAACSSSMNAVSLRSRDRKSCISIAVHHVESWCCQCFLLQRALHRVAAIQSYMKQVLVKATQTKRKQCCCCVLQAAPQAPQPAAHLLYSSAVTTPHVQVMLLRSRSLSIAYTFKLQSRHAARMTPLAAPSPVGTAWHTADTKLGRCSAFVCCTSMWSGSSGGLLKTCSALWSSERKVGWPLPQVEMLFMRLPCW